MKFISNYLLTILFSFAMIYKSSRSDVCGSVGTGRRARLRILWSLRSCGFKSHLPQEKKRVKPYGLALFFYAEESLEPKAQGLLAINSSSVGSVGKRSTGPLSECTFRCTFPPHPIFRNCLLFKVFDAAWAEMSTFLWIIIQERLLD